MDIRGLKKRLRSGRPVWGSWITLGHPSVAEILCQAGFDWLVVDLEHSVIDLAETQTLLQVIAAHGVVPLVRVTSNDPQQIKRVMDAGAQGVIVPMVNSAEEARDAVRAVKYPPEGTRGVGLGRAQEYGFEFEKYAARINRESLVVVQIEHKDAVSQIDEIFATPGVDAFFVGPYDLSGSLGVPGRFEHPRMKAALDTIRRAARKSAIVPGFHVIQPRAADVRRRLREGYRFLAVSLDTLFLGTACRSVLADLGKRS